MNLSDEQIQDLLRVGNPTDEECRLIRMGWDAAMRERDATSIPGDILSLESCGFFDEHDNPDAYGTILDAMNFVQQHSRQRGEG